MKGKIIIIVLLLLSVVGCTSKNNQDRNSDDTVSGGTAISNRVMKAIPEYEDSDAFFNNNFHKGEDGIYFEAGEYIYQLDPQNNLKKLFSRTINDKYFIYASQYYNGQLYCLVLKINHDYGNAPLGIATIGVDGSNFQYVSDLIDSDGALLHADIAHFRVKDNNIYILDMYSSDTPTVYTYSIRSSTIVSAEKYDIYQKRYEFYKGCFPEYPYTQIQHVDKENFYQTTRGESKIIFTQYNPITKTTKEYDLSRYYDFSGDNVVGFYVDLVEEHWFIFSNKGVFMVDKDFQNEQQLLDGSIFEPRSLTSRGDRIIQLLPISPK